MRCAQVEAVAFPLFLKRDLLLDQFHCQAFLFLMHRLHKAVALLLTDFETDTDDLMPLCSEHDPIHCQFSRLSCVS